MAHGRRAAEDFADDATLRVKRHPLRSVTLAVTAGAAAGCLIGFGLGWLAAPRRKRDDGIEVNAGCTRLTVVLD